MPTVNLFHQRNSDDLSQIAKPLKKFVAQQLACGAIELTAEEVSVRYVAADMSEAIAEVEVEIMAHAFEERVEKQDDICLAVRDFILKEVDSLNDVGVWLSLSELGHSWEENSEP